MERKDFIKLNTGLVGGILLGKNLLDNINEEDRKIKKFGVQLYTLREILADDTEHILKQLASFGYTQIESYEGPKGMFWGQTPAGFKKMTSDLGMQVVSTHCDISIGFERKMHEAIEAGLSYIISASEPDKGLEGYKKLAEEFNIKGELCRQNGIRFAFHNHDHSFIDHEGVTGQQILMRNTDPKLVDFQMDIYWVITGGHDPVDWLNKYPGRFKLCHVKDRSKTPVKYNPDSGKNSVNLGTGSIDFKRILGLASKAGMEYYIVEQEFYPNGSPVEAARADANYMKKLKI